MMRTMRTMTILRMMMRWRSEACDARMRYSMQCPCDVGYTSGYVVKPLFFAKLVAGLTFGIGCSLHGAAAQCFVYNHG